MAGGPASAGPRSSRTIRPGGIVFSSTSNSPAATRPGATAWTDPRQHTGRTDLALNDRGEERARRLGERLRRFPFARVFTSPLRRAARTCELAGFGAGVGVDPDLLEWDYGQFEGKL